MKLNNSELVEAAIQWLELQGEIDDLNAKLNALQLSLESCSKRLCSAMPSHSPVVVELAPGWYGLVQEGSDGYSGMACVSPIDLAAKQDESEALLPGHSGYVVPCEFDIE